MVNIRVGGKTFQKEKYVSEIHLLFDNKNNVNLFSNKTIVKIREHTQII